MTRAGFPEEVMSELRPENALAQLREAVRRALLEGGTACAKALGWMQGNVAQIGCNRARVEQSE